MNCPRVNRKWSESEEAILERAFRSNESLELLSRTHLRSPEAIEEKLVEIGWIKRRDEIEFLDRPEYVYLVAAEPVNREIEGVCRGNSRRSDGYHAMKDHE